MFSSHWRHITFALCLALLACFGYSQEQPQGAQEVTELEVSAPEQLSSPPSVVSVQPEASTVLPASGEEEGWQHNERDLLAQERMAKAAEWMNYASWVSAFLVLVGTGALIWTLFETRQVTRVTRDIGEKQVRSYLSIEKSRFAITKEGNVWAFLVVKNYGQSPALITEVTARLWPNTFDAVDPTAFVSHSDLRPNVSIAANGEQSFGLFWNIENFPEKSKDIFLNLHDIAVITVEGSVQWKDVFQTFDTITFRSSSLNPIEYFKGESSHKRSGDLNPLGKPLGT